MQLFRSEEKEKGEIGSSRWGEGWVERVTALRYNKVLIKFVLMFLIWKQNAKLLFNIQNTTFPAKTDEKSIHSVS